MYNKILKWYIQKLWTKEMVSNALEKNIITADEYITILQSRQEE